MSEHYWVAYTQLIKSLHEQGGLRCGGPDARAWTLAVTKSWPIEANHAVAEVPNGQPNHLG